MLWIIFALALVPVLALVLNQRDRNLERQILTVLLRRGEMYGLQIIEALEEEFDSKAGGLVYGVLRRLEREGFITSRWSDEIVEEREGARRRYYRLTGKRFRLEYRRSVGEDISFVDLDSTSLSVLLASNLCLQEAYQQSVKRSLELMKLDR